jgi:hypothetical protein
LGFSDTADAPARSFVEARWVAAFSFDSPRGFSESYRGLSTDHGYFLGSMETKNAKESLAVLGVLFIATLTIQTATAAAHHARKVARAPAPLTQQIRDSHATLFAPAPARTRSCDVFACYED